MSGEKHCDKQCDNTVVEPRNNSCNYLIIVVLYILLAIILGSLIIY